MLTLPIKKKWFDMILSGEKKEEYREITPYYISRFRTVFEISYRLWDSRFIELFKQDKILKNKIFEVKFRNGYSKISPSFIAKCTLSVGTGREEWGAEKGKEYFVLTIQEILKGSEQV